MLIKYLKIKPLLLIIFTSAILMFSSTITAKECKGMSKSTCSSATSCTWVSGYKTKTGSTIASYCRNKAGKKSTTAKKDKKKAKDKKNKSDKKKSTSKEKTKDKTTKSDSKKSN